MPKLHQAITTYLQVERRPLTNYAYKSFLNRFAEAIGPSNQVERITYEILLDYQADLRTRLKPSTVSTYTTFLMAFFSWCTKRGYCEQSPAADLIRKSVGKEVEKDRAIPPEDLRKLLDYTRITNARNYAILMLLADSGCRVGALCNLTRANLHEESLYADVIEKGGVKARIRFGSETAAALTGWVKISRPADNAKVFGMSRGGVATMIKRTCKKVGTSRLWFPHSFRHAVGHAYALAGVPVSITAKKLNHRNVSTTLAHYYPNTDPYLEEVSSRLSLAALKTPEELRAPAPAPITVLKKTGSS